MRRRTQLGVGSAVCLTSSLGVHAAGSDEPSSQLTEITVTGRPSVDDYATSLQDTPQNVTLVTKEVLTQQGADSLTNALRNVPGITLNAGEGGTHGDNINLRGFTASDDFFLDGLRDTGFYTRDSFDLEGIEVYKGPASTLFGRGSTGGVVNQVSKTPQIGDFERATLAGGTNGEIRGTADLNYALNPSTAVRLNAMAQNAGVTDRDFVRNRRWGVAPSLVLGLGNDMTLTLQYLHQQQNDVPDYGIPFAFGSPVPVPRNTYYGLPSDDRTRANDDVVTARFVDRVSDHLWFTDTARYGNYFFDSRQTAAHYGAAPPATGTPLDTVLTFRDRPSAQGNVRTLMNDAGLHLRLETGAVWQQFVVGFEADKEEANLTRFANQLNQIPGTPILAPDPFEPFPGHQSRITQRPDTTTNTISGLIEDIADFGERWQVTAAVRVDRFQAEFNEPITRQHYDHTDTIASPRASIVYKPVPLLSLYASYGTSYDPSAENLSLSKATAALGPEKDRTYEFGAKSTILDNRLALQADVFQTEMTNARVGDPTNPTAPQILAGSERVRGAELDASGHITDELEVTAGYTHLTSVTLESTNAASVGAPLINTAPNQANLWTVYEMFADTFKVGAGLNWLDRRPADIANTAHVPGYVVFDAMVSYRFNPHLSLQLNGYNLGNRYYYTNSYFSSPVENHAVPGAGRSALLTAALDF